MPGGTMGSLFGIAVPPWMVTTDAQGDLVFTSGNGNEILFLANGAIQVGAGNNFLVGANGVIQVYGTIITGSGGVPATLGGSPPPAQGGPLHFGANQHQFTAVGPSTTEVLGFEPLTGTHTDWLELDVYLHITTITGAAIFSVQVTYMDEGGNAQTDILKLVTSDGATNGAGNATAVGHYHVHVQFPNQQPAVLGNNVVVVNVIESPAATTGTALFAGWIKRIGTLIQNY